MALGARAGRHRCMILRQGAVQLVGGLLTGTLLAPRLRQPPAAFVVGIGAQDLASFVIVGVLISRHRVRFVLMPAQSRRAPDAPRRSSS